MGITGLLPLLKPVTKTTNISDFKDRRVAIDGYAWLHKASFGCCLELATGEDCDKWMGYCLTLIDMLLSHNILVHMVFDGADLPAKKHTEIARAAKRAVAMKEGLKLMSTNKTLARQYFASAVDVTPRMAAQLIQCLKETRPKVLCTVAPYEADAQLAFLCREGQVDAIIGEDSDTIPYGCKEMIFKLKFDGTCDTVVLADVYSTYLPGLDLRKFTPEMVLALCVGAGCDYLESPKGFGLKTSYSILFKQRSVDRMLRNMRLLGKIPIIPANLKKAPQGGERGVVSEKMCVVDDADRDNVDNGNNGGNSGSNGVDDGDAMTIDGMSTIDDMTCSDDTPHPAPTQPTHTTHTTTTTHIAPAQKMRPVGTGTMFLEYEFGFYKAIATFKHQIIFNTITRKTCHLSPIVLSEIAPQIQFLYTDYNTDHSTSTSSSSSTVHSTSGNINYDGFDFLGTPIDPTVARGIADGLLDPCTHLPFNLPAYVAKQPKSEKEEAAEKTAASKSERNESIERKNEKKNESKKGSFFSENISEKVTENGTETVTGNVTGKEDMEKAMEESRERGRNAERFMEESRAKAREKEREEGREPYVISQAEEDKLYNKGMRKVVKCLMLEKEAKDLNEARERMVGNIGSVGSVGTAAKEAKGKGKVEKVAAPPKRGGGRKAMVWVEQPRWVPKTEMRKGKNGIMEEYTEAKLGNKTIYWKKVIPSAYASLSNPPVRSTGVVSYTNSGAAVNQSTASASAVDVAVATGMGISVLSASDEFAAVLAATVAFKANSSSSSSSSSGAVSASVEGGGRGVKGGGEVEGVYVKPAAVAAVSIVRLVSTTTATTAAIPPSGVSAAATAATAAAVARMKSTTTSSSTTSSTALKTSATTAVKVAEKAAAKPAIKSVAAKTAVKTPSTISRTVSAKGASSSSSSVASKSVLNVFGSKVMTSFFSKAVPVPVKAKASTEENHTLSTVKNTENTEKSTEKGGKIDKTDKSAKTSSVNAAAGVVGVVGPFLEVETNTNSWKDIEIIEIEDSNMEVTIVDNVEVVMVENTVGDTGKNVGGNDEANMEVNVECIEEKIEGNIDKIVAPDGAEEKGDRVVEEMMEKIVGDGEVERGCEEVEGKGRGHEVEVEVAEVEQDREEGDEDKQEGKEEKVENEEDVGVVSQELVIEDVNDAKESIGNSNNNDSDNNNTNSNDNKSNASGNNINNTNNTITAPSEVKSKFFRRSVTATKPENTTEESNNENGNENKNENSNENKDGQKLTRMLTQDLRTPVKKISTYDQYSYCDTNEVSLTLSAQKMKLSDNNGNNGENNDDNDGGKMDVVSDRMNVMVTADKADNRGDGNNNNDSNDDNGYSSDNNINNRNNDNSDNSNPFKIFNIRALDSDSTTQNKSKLRKTNASKGTFAGPFTRCQPIMSVTPGDEGTDGQKKDIFSTALFSYQA